MSALADVVGGIHRQIDADEAMKWLSRLVEFDRYQGSAGIAAAADFVAAEAERVGLVDVEVLRFPADGRTAWWTFTAPASWTPRYASLAIGAGPELLTYPAQSYALAAGSAEADAELPLALASDAVWPVGAVVLVESARDLGPELFTRMAAEKASGFCAVTHPMERGQAQAGRIELSPTSELFGFSVLPTQMAALLLAHQRGDRVRVIVDIDRTERTFPVVVARTPSGSGDELMLTAHLCHPAPGANDNASGVAAALAIGRVLAERRLQRPVRFVWGPEFVGLAAYIHQSQTRPLAAINLDMVGENQQLCGGPLIIEQSPEYLPHFLNAVLDACVRAIPASARSYSGAVGCDTWAWRCTPFVGASDHAILADRAIGVPAAQLGHWPDRFNHSSADTLDKVDPQELRRAATTAASALAVMASADLAPISDLVTRWTAERMIACLPPSHKPDATLLLARRCAYGQAALDALRLLGVPEETLYQGSAWLSTVRAGFAERLAEDGEPPAVGPPLRRAWPGPFNLRALIHAATAADRAWFDRESLADRGGFYARAMALAQSIDGDTDAEHVIRIAQLDSGLDIDPGFGRGFLAAMTRAGWITDSERG